MIKFKYSFIFEIDKLDFKILIGQQCFKILNLSFKKKILKQKS